MKEALKLALEALEYMNVTAEHHVDNRIPEAAITAIKEALSSPNGEAQPKPSTDEKISLIAHNIDTGDWNDLNFRECWHEGFKAGFREAEVEHNIKG